MYKVLTIFTSLISVLLIFGSHYELKDLNETEYEKNLNIASELYLKKKEIPTSVLLSLVPKDHTEFELYYATTYSDQKLSETDFFHHTTQLIFEQVTSHKNNDFYLPCLQLISFADGEFADRFIEYLERIIEMDKEKFCRSIRKKEYCSRNPIKHYSELHECIFDKGIKTIEAKQQKDIDFFDYEDYNLGDDGNLKPVGDLVFLKGCNWYCGGTISTISATSELATQGINTYTPENTHDFNHNTAWIEGKENYGIGESISYTIDFREDEFYGGQLGIHTLIIANGYKKSKKAWQANSRIKKLRMYINNESYYDILLKDSFEIQTVTIDTLMFPKNEITKITFEIKEVYKGAKYKDTALSLLMFDGVGVH